jgi:hypothetical protein
VLRHFEIQSYKVHIGDVIHLSFSYLKFFLKEFLLGEPMNMKQVLHCEIQINEAVFWLDEKADDSCQLVLGWLFVEKFYCLKHKLSITYFHGHDEGIEPVEKC